MSIMARSVSKSALNSMYGYQYKPTQWKIIVFGKSKRMKQRLKDHFFLNVGGG